MKRLGILLSFALLSVACTDAGPIADPESPSFDVVGDGGPNFSEWSPATVVGPPISLDTRWEGCPFISKDGLDLYFRIWTGGPSSGGSRWDIFVSHRESAEAPWGPPVNLGPNINTEANELCSYVTIDGHWLYFVSNRQDVGSEGLLDLFVSHRKDKDDPTGWETPKNLTVLNSGAFEHGHSLFEDEATGETVIYFSSSRGGDLDVYSAKMIDKENFEPPTPVTELNSEYGDAHAFIRRKDGLEVILFSDRPGPDAQGEWDLYVATRATTADPWSSPVNLGPDINSEGNDVRPSISWDGTTLYFWTDRGPSMDIYQATRTRIRGRR